MSQTKLRRAQDIENFKSSVLDAAIQLMKEENDWGLVSINKIAALIRYTTPNIYHYFENKDDIHFHLGQRGLELLGDKLKNIASLEIVDKNEKLFVLGLQFWEFSIEHPELYDLMYHTRQKKIDKSLLLENINVIKTVIKEVKSHIQTDEDAYKAHQGFHCLIHGFISIKMNNRIPINDQSYFEELFKESLRKYINQI